MQKTINKIENNYKTEIKKTIEYLKTKGFILDENNTIYKFNIFTKQFKEIDINNLLSSEQIDLIQGRGKTKLHETYIKTNWEQLKSDYIEALPSILIFDNWGYSYNKNRIDLKEYPLGLANEINIYYDLNQKGVLTNKQFDLIKSRLLKNIIN